MKRRQHAPVIRLRRRSLLSTAACLALGACSSEAPAPEAPEVAAAPLARKVVAIGDVHGDLDALRGALRLAGAIDANDSWSGGAMVVVQVGDQLDRGDDEPEILALLDRLAAEATRAGGELIVLTGNHELMNVAGDLRYVTPAGLRDFDGVPGADPDDPRFASIPEASRARAAAFAPGTKLAAQLARRPLHAIVDGTLFVHAGVLPAHLDAGLDALDREADAWANGELRQPPRAVADSNGPLWTRAYGGPEAQVDCASARAVLDRLGLARMVVAHTVQPHINSVCDGRVWRVDVGLSKHYGGPREVLVIEGDTPRVLTDPAR